MLNLHKHRSVIFIFLIWLFIVNVFALIALNRFNLSADTAYSWIPQTYYQEFGLNFNVIHAQWDSFWLLDIVENGYYLRDGNIANVVFFPLYPLLVKLLSFLFVDSIFSGWLVSVVSLFAAVIFLDKLIKKHFPRINSVEAIVFLLLFPTAYFFNAVYTESLFLFLSVATLYWAKERNWKWVAIYGFFAALTRITGVLLFLPVAWYLLESYQFKFREIVRWKNAVIFMIPLGLLSFFGFHYIAFDNFLLFFEMESLWGRSFVINEDHFVASHPVQITNLLLDTFFVAISLIASILVWKKIDKGMAIYMIATIGTAVATGTFMSIGRYVLILFPLCILAASLKNTYIKITWLLLSCLLFALYATLFVNHYWAG